MRYDQLRNAIEHYITAAQTTPLLSRTSGLMTTQHPANNLGQHVVFRRACRRHVFSWLLGACN
jgi:hypothetical protein